MQCLENSIYNFQCFDWMQSDVVFTFRYMYKTTQTFLNMINYVMP